MKKNSFSCKRDNRTIRGHVWGVPERSRHAVILSHGFLANERMCWKYAKLLADMEKKETEIRGILKRIYKELNLDADPFRIQF